MINSNIDNLIEDTEIEEALTVALGGMALVSLYFMYKQLKAKYKMAKNKEEKAKLKKEMENTELKIQQAKEKEKK
jgi:hypothetical protein